MIGVTGSAPETQPDARLTRDQVIENGVLVENALMIASLLRRQGRILLVYSAVMFLGPGVLAGFALGRGRSAGALVGAVVVWAVLLLVVGVAQVVVARRSDRALQTYVAAASPALAGDPTAPLAPAQVVRRRVARRSTSYVVGFAAPHPPAIALLLRVLAPDGGRLAMALVPLRPGTYRAGSYVGVRVGAAHPDVAVLDPAATPETMRKEYESALRRPGTVLPPVGWADATRSALAGWVGGLLLGLVVGVLLP